MTKIHTTLRSLVRNPAFTGVSMLTLALGIAAAVSVFTLVDGVLLKQLPFPNADRVVQIDHAAPGLDLESMGMSHKLFLRYRAESQTLERIAVFDSNEVTLVGDGPAERRGGSRVSPALFDVLGMVPAHGRTFLAAEGEPGTEAAVAVIGHRLFEARYGGDPAVVGRTISINGDDHIVVGVMPPGFAFPESDTQVWRPRAPDLERPLGAFNDRAVGLLRRGVDIETAQADLERVNAGLEDAFPEERSAGILAQSGFTPQLRSQLEEVVGGVKQVLWSLLLAVGLILAVACANVANLFLVRVEERSAELAVRSALGARRRQIIRDLLSESLVVASGAGAIGLGLAWLTVRLVVQLGPAQIPRLGEVGIDGRVVVFAAVVSVVAGLVFGLLPALRATLRSGALGVEKARAASAGRGRHRLRNVLVGAQMALGLVLLIGCGLVVRSFMALRAVDPGFRSESAVTFRLALPESDYPLPADRVRFIEQASERLAALPGATAVGVASYLPLSSQGTGSGYSIEGVERTEGEPPPVFMNAHVGPGYLEALGVPLLEGRTLVADDHRARSGNVVVSAALARRAWPGQSPIGRRLTSSDPTNERWMTVVGVVGDVHFFGLDRPAPEFVYRPLLGLPDDDADLPESMSFVVRTAQQPTALAPDINRTLASLDDAVPVSGLGAVADLVRRSQARMSFAVTILLLAALMALVIAAVGLYGTISYLVSRRQSEIGIRMALGADQAAVGGMMLRQGMTVASIGAAVGLVLALVLAFVATRVSVDLLYATSAFDPPTFLLVPVVLLAVAAFATSLPALRATRVAPVEALRHS